MNKILLIIRREYLTRVRKRTFILSTLLFPLLYLGLIFGTAWIGAKTKSRLEVGVIDSSGYSNRGMLERANQSDSSMVLHLENMSADSLKEKYTSLGYDGYAVIPVIPNWQADIPNVIYKSAKKSGNAKDQIQGRLNMMWTDIKNEKLGIDSVKKSIIASSRIKVEPKDLEGANSNEGTAKGIGFISGFLIYFILLLYGSQVMMGVMEEKTNRIAEIIVSSVKPFQLMLGKIIGIGMVALTQFLLWIAFMFLIYNVTKASSGTSEAVNNVMAQVQQNFTGINLPLIVGCFIFYFLAGFFFYAALYAAVGSSVNEDMREAQSLSFPITLLVIFSIGLMSIVINDPTGPVAFWGSIIPLSSPILMMGRIPFGVPGTVPVWQLLLSMGLLVIGFLFTVWLSGKIYRTGILMYGKKPSWKEMIRWAFRKS